MKRHFSTVDDKTGYELLLSECSYNMAMDWLSKELAKYGLEVCGIHYDRDRGLTKLYSGRPDKSGLNFGRKFYYDEERGYLLGE